MQNRIYVADNSRSKKLSVMIACMLLTVGIAAFFATLTHNVVCNIVILLEAAIISAALVALEKKPVAVSVFRAAAVMLFALWVMFDFTGIRRAMLSGVNSVIEYANAAFTKDFVKLGVEEATNTELIAFYTILTVTAAILINYAVNKRSVVWITVLAFVFLIAALALKVTGAFIILPLIIIGWAMCWSSATAGGSRSALYIGAGLLAVFIAGTAVLGMVDFNGFKSLEDLHEDTASFIYKTRFGEDTLPKGDLFKANTMLKENDERLKVTFEKPHSLYLKGFTGGVFNENRWTEYKPDTYLGEWSGMLDYFKVNHFDINGMFAKYYILDKRDVEYSRVEVENTGADRSFVYLPFTASQMESSTTYDYRDLYEKSGKLFGAKKYVFSDAVTDEKPERLPASSWAGGSKDVDKKDFLEKENVYRAFVRDAYLEIDERTKDEIDEVFYKDFDFNAENVGIYTVTTRIRSILKLITSYTESPEEPTDKDFIGWFLYDYRKGNAPYYATAAVMAYRAAGIPARYAEGYIVTDTDVENLNMTQKNTVILSGRNAHAWVEIYRDGMGWISVEVTPGFYVEDPEDMEVIDISQNLEMIGGAGSSTSEHYTGSNSMYSPEAATRPEDRMSSGLRILLTLICLLTIITMVIYIRYIILVYLKNERIYGQAKPDTANYMMMYLCEALKADGIEANPDNTIAIKRDLLDKYKVFNSHEFDRVTSLISRSSYGGASLREHELRTIRIFIEKLSAEVYEGKAFWKKLILRYVKIV